jgi:amidase
MLLKIVSNEIIQFIERTDKIMSDFDDLTSIDAISQADLVRRKEVKAIELVESTIARIERLNPTLNAVITPMYEQARIAANREPTDAPFTGVPFLLKDLVASYGGVPKTSGSAFLRDYIPEHDSELVARLKRTGLIVIGKTNTPEFGALPTTEPRPLCSYGTCQRRRRFDSDSGFLLRTFWP